MRLYELLRQICTEESLTDRYLWSFETLISIAVSRRINMLSEEPAPAEWRWHWEMYDVYTWLAKRAPEHASRVDRELAKLSSCEYHNPILLSRMLLQWIQEASSDWFCIYIAQTPVWRSYVCGILSSIIENIAKSEKIWEQVDSGHYDSGAAVALKSMADHIWNDEEQRDSHVHGLCTFLRSPTNTTWTFVCEEKSVYLRMEDIVVRHHFLHHSILFVTTDCVKMKITFTKTR